MEISYVVTEEWCELKVSLLLVPAIYIFLYYTFAFLNYLGMIFNRNFELGYTHTPFLEEECNSADSADELPRLNICNVYSNTSNDIVIHIYVTSTFQNKQLATIQHCLFQTASS